MNAYPHQHNISFRIISTCLLCFFMMAAALPAARATIDQRGLTWDHNAERVISIFADLKNGAPAEEFQP